MRKAALFVLLGLFALGCPSSRGYVELEVNGQGRTLVVPLRLADLEQSGALPVELTVTITDHTERKRNPVVTHVDVLLGDGIEILDDGQWSRVPEDLGFSLYLDPSAGPTEAVRRIRFSGPAALGDYKLTFSGSSSGFEDGVARVIFRVTESGPNPVASLSYDPGSLQLTTGQPMTSLLPSINRVITDWSVAPELPDGLSLDPSTGAISGSPTVVSAAADYTVTAKGDGFEVTATVRIEVRPPAASSRWVWTMERSDILVSAIEAGSLHPTSYRVVDETAEFHSIAVTPDGRFAYTLENIGTLRLFRVDPKTGRPDAGTILPQSSEGFSHLAITRDSRTLVTNGDRISAWTIDPLSGELSYDHQASNYSGAVEFTLHPAEDLVYFNNALLGRLEVRRLRDFGLIQHYDRTELGRLAIHPDGYLYVILNNGTIEQYDASSVAEIAAGAEPLTPMTPGSLSLGRAVLSFAFGAHDLYVSSTTSNGTEPGSVQRLEVTGDGTLAMRQRLTLDGRVAQGLIVTGQGTVHVPAAGQPLVWNLENDLDRIVSRTITRARGGSYGHGVMAVVAGPAGPLETARVFALDAGGREVGVFDRLPGSGLVDRTVLAETCNEPVLMQFNPARTHAYVACADGKIATLSYDAATPSFTWVGGTTVAAPTESSADLTGFALAPDGVTAYAASGQDLYVFAVDATTGALSVRGFYHHYDDAITKLRFSPDGTLYAAFDTHIEAITGSTADYIEVDHPIDDFVFHPTGWAMYVLHTAEKKIIRVRRQEDAYWDYENSIFQFAGSEPTAIAFDSANARLFAMDAGNEELIKYSADPSSGNLLNLLDPIALPSKPLDFVLGAAGRRVFVALELPGVAMFDIEDLGQGAGVETGRVTTTKPHGAMAKEGH